MDLERTVHGSERYNNQCYRNKQIIRQRVISNNHMNSMKRKFVFLKELVDML